MPATTRNLPKMVGVGRGVKVPAEHKQAYAVARKRMDDAYKKEARLFVDGKPKAGYDEAVKEVASAHKHLQGVIDVIRRITNPPAPKEETRPEAPAKVERAKKVAKSNAGVPVEYLKHEDGPFKPGWDAKYKSDLVKSALGESDKFSKDDAVARLQQRGWMAFLDKARARRDK